MKDHKIVGEKDISPEFCNSANLDFQAQYSGDGRDLHLPQSNGHYGTGINKYLTRISI